MRNGALRAAVAALFLGGAQTVLAAEPFDFGYVIDGPEALRPALVFHDGSDTWIQPRRGVETAVAGMPVEHRGPYLVVRGLPYQVVLTAGGEIVRVSRIDAPRAAIPPLPPAAPAPTAACEPARVAVPFPRLHSFLNQAATTGVEAAAKAARSARRVTVIGRPDTRSERLARARAERVREGLILRGVPASRIETRVELAPAPGREAEVIAETICAWPAVPAGVFPQAPAREASPGAEAASRAPSAQGSSGKEEPPAGAGLPAQPTAAAQPPAEPKAAAGPDARSPAPEPAAAAQAAEEAKPPKAQAAKAGAPEELVVRPGERLSKALEAFLAPRGVALRWLATTDLEASREARFLGADWKRSVALAAAAAGYSAVLVRETNTVYVRDARPMEEELAK